MDVKALFVGFTLLAWTFHQPPTIHPTKSQIQISTNEFQVVFQENEVQDTQEAAVTEVVSRISSFSKVAFVRTHIADGDAAIVVADCGCTLPINNQCIDGVRQVDYKILAAFDKRVVRDRYHSLWISNLIPFLVVIVLRITGIYTIRTT